MRDEPEVLERAGELISLAEERYQSLTSYKTRPVTRGSGTLKRALEQLVDSDYGFGISTFTVKEFYEMALAQLKAKSIAREDEVIETVSETTIRTELNGLVNAGLLKVDKSGKVHVYRFDERVLGAYHSSDEAFSEIADSVDMAKLEDNEAAWIKRRYLDGKLAAALGDELLRYDYLPNLKRIGEGESRTIIIQAESIGEHLGFVASLELMLEYADGKVQVIIDASAVENIKGFLEATGLSMEGEGHRIVIEVNDTKALLETARSNSDHKDKNIVTVGDQGYFRRRNWFSPDYGKVCKLLIEEATEGKANIGILPAAIGLVSGNMLEDLVTVMDNENNLFLLSPQDVSQAYSETLNSYREMLSAM